MLGGEGNAGERWKTTIGLISKKATLHVQHTFLYISLPLFWTTTTWNFQKRLSYTFFGGTVVRVLRSLFFHCRSFLPCIGGRWHFSFSHRRYKIFIFVFQQKTVSFVFFVCRSTFLSPFFSLSFAGLLPLFLCLSLALYSKFVDMKINLSLRLGESMGASGMCATHAISLISMKLGQFKGSTPKLKMTNWFVVWIFMVGDSPPNWFN